MAAGRAADPHGRGEGQLDGSVSDRGARTEGGFGVHAPEAGAAMGLGVHPAHLLGAGSRASGVGACAAYGIPRTLQQTLMGSPSPGITAMASNRPMGHRPLHQLNRSADDGQFGLQVGDLISGGEITSGHLGHWHSS